MAITFTYAEATNTVVVTEGTVGTPATFADFVHFDRTVATAACTIGSGAELMAATAVGNPTVLNLTYQVRPVEFKALPLSVTTAQNGGAAVSGDETAYIEGTSHIWCALTGASASGQKVVPIADMTHIFQVGQTVLLLDLSTPTNVETDVIASIQEGVSITMTNNNTNTYAEGDIVGVYQDELVDVSAAFGTATSTKNFGQVAQVTFTGFDGTNTGKVDQPIWGVIWDKGGGQYQVDAHFNIGGGVSTYFTSSDYEQVYMSDGCDLNVLASGTLTLGVLVGDYGSRGVFWNFSPNTNFNKITAAGATFKLYASMLQCRAAARPTNWGTFDLRDSILSCNENAGSAAYKRYQCEGTMTIRDCLFTDMYNLQLLVDGTYEKVKIHSTVSGIQTYDSISVTDTRISESSQDIQIGGANKTINIIDPEIHLGTVKIVDAETNVIKEQYTCNIYVTDKGGVDLQNVVVDCEDTNGDAVWAAGTVTTAADGTITEQVITYKTWTGTSETLATLTPHKFTLSKAGYETLILDNVTVDHPFRMHLELQAQKQPPAPWQEGVM